MPLKMSVMMISAIALLFLGACSNGNQATKTASSPTASAPAEGLASAGAEATIATTAKTGKIQSHGGQGGQVVESGQYHLELATAKEPTGTHIDFFLQKGDNHAPIPNAKVTAQVQLPDGSQKSLNMKYDADGKHYIAMLPSTAAGEYKVAILTDINGEKVNGRFSFKQ